MAHEQTEFIEQLWEYYHDHGRHDLPWRQPDADGSFDPYKIMVSELMLQQTQVSRVVPKYAEFLGRFPSVGELAKAELGEVLRVWQGLGYNRRAKFLWHTAQILDKVKYFPKTVGEWVKLPGVGANTAGAILAYAYNQPIVFIETNIRTVYIHHFFSDESGVHDKEVLALVEQTLDHEHPREFYWALMDYGSHLKITVGNLNTASKHYAKQSKFHGSRRQIRGAVIRQLSTGPAALTAIQANIADERLMGVLDDLVAEGLVRMSDGAYSL